MQQINYKKQAIRILQITLFVLYRPNLGGGGRIGAVEAVPDSD